MVEAQPASKMVGKRIVISFILHNWIVERTEFVDDKSSAGGRAVLACWGSMKCDVDPGGPLLRIRHQARGAGTGKKEPS